MANFAFGVVQTRARNCHCLHSNSISEEGEKVVLIPVGCGNGIWRNKNCSNEQIESNVGVTGVQACRCAGLVL